MRQNRACRAALGRGVAGETPTLPGTQTYPYKPIKGEGIRCSSFHGDDAIEICT